MFRAPRRRVFDGVAQRFFTKKRGADGARFYIVPTTTAQEEPVNESDFYDAIVDRAADKLADRVQAEWQARYRAGDIVGALTAQRDDLSERRARRSA